MAAFEKRLEADVPGVAYTFSQPIQMRMEDLLQGVRGDVAISLYGDDLKVLEAKAREITKVVQGVRGAADVKPEAQAGMPSLTIAVDRDKAARYGINASDILDVVDSIGGRVSGVVYGSDNSVTDIVVRLSRADRADVQRVRDLPVGRSGRRMVPLSLVADIDVATGPAQISRDRLQRRISIEANVRGRDAQSFVAEAQAAVRDRVKLPPRYSMGWSGQFQDLREATARLSIVVPSALGHPAAARRHVRRRPSHPADLPQRTGRRDGRHRRSHPARHALLDLGGDRLHRHLRHRDPQRRGADEHNRSCAARAWARARRRRARRRRDSGQWSRRPWWRRSASSRWRSRRAPAPRCSAPSPPW